MICKADSIATRVTDLNSNIITIIEKPNTDKATSNNKPSINLENSSCPKDSSKNSGRNKKLLAKNSFSYDIMRSIPPPNEKDGACIDSLSSQQQKGKQSNNKFYIQQTLPNNFFLGKTKPNSSENIYLIHI